MATDERIHPASDYPGRDLEAMAEAGRYYEWVIDSFAQHLKGVVAEVGAGSGNFSKLLLETAPQQLIAIEPSESMFALLTERVGRDERVTIHEGFLRDVAENYRERIDSILYVNVLEHVEDDHEELKYAWRVLKPGGHLCIFVPALQWLFSDHDASIGHFRRYHRSDLVQLVEQSRFRVLNVSYFDIAGVLPWLVMMKLLKRSPGQNSVRLYDRLVVPVMRRLEAIVYPPFGKNLVLVAQKPIR